MSVVVKQCAVSAVAIVLLLFAGCSPSTQPSVSDQSAAAPKPAAPPEPVTAKTAFWPMYTSARNWAADVVALRLMPSEVPGFKNEAGKAAMWQATFASPSQHEFRVYSYAIVTVQPDIHKGVVASLGQPWRGVTRDVMPIDLSSFNADSDAAYQAAVSAAEAWLKKNPDKQISTFQLGSAYKFDVPVWFLMWGDKKAGYAAYVDANSGKLLKGK